MEGRGGGFAGEGAGRLFILFYFFIFLFFCFFQKQSGPQICLHDEILKLYHPLQHVF